jgi:hypothetical protein
MLTKLNFTKFYRLFNKHIGRKIIIRILLNILGPIEDIVSE